MRCRKICEGCEYFFEDDIFQWEKEFGIVFYPVYLQSTVQKPLYRKKQTLWWCGDEHCLLLLEHSLIEWSKS